MIEQYIIVLGVSFLLSFTIFPKAIDKFTNKKLLVKDIYKASQPKIPSQGAIVILFVLFFVSSILPLLERIFNRLGFRYENLSIDEVGFCVLLVISMFAFFGIVDDLVDLPWRTKIILPVIFSFPIIVVYEPQNIVFPLFGEVSVSNNFNGIFISDIFKVIIFPIYIMVVANLVNMHSGFNGLQSGLSTILLVTIFIKCYLNDSLDNLSILLILIGSLFAFWLFNKYPAKIIEGNSGPLIFGSCMGCFIVLNDLYFFGIVILLPHIIDFLLFVYVRIVRGEFVKFGQINDKGFIISPNPFKLKFLFPYFFELKEYEVVNWLYLLTVLFCFIGIIFF
tara:strand:+ start:713 stop:1720 length:1008 start_codon:yes stop_codon:yes gene_type:complete